MGPDVHTARYYWSTRPQDRKSARYLWSRILVLQYLAREGAVEEANPFEALARRLLNKKPRNRPLLHPSPSICLAFLLTMFP
jgi:hypothetical protein